MAQQVSQTISTTKTLSWQGVKPLPLLITFSVGMICWLLPVPEGLTPQAWHLFSIFLAMITGLIVRPLPAAPITLIGGFIGLLTHAIPMEALMKGYGQPAIWLVIFSFFLAKALIKSGLANRMAYLLISLFGKTVLGTSYSIILSELFISPFIPSISARSGGVVFPIAYSVVSHHEGSSLKKSNVSKFLLLSIVNGSVICSTLFLTSMAGNPMAAEMSLELNLNLSWGGWAIAAIVPGLAALFINPWLISKIIRPEQLAFPEAKETANKKLQEMGPLSTNEWLMLLVFGLVLALWISGSSIGVDSTTTIMIGLGLLFCTGNLSWKDCLQDESAWDTLIWLSLLVSFGMELKQVGFFNWVGANLLLWLGDVSWQIGFFLISLIYFATRYLFASNIAHITAMYFAFLTAAVDIGTPPLLAAYALGFLGGLPGGLTHYSSSTATIFFGSGFISLKEWWKVGAIAGFANFFIWAIIGSLWWKIIGLY